MGVQSPGVTAEKTELLVVNTQWLFCESSSLVNFVLSGLGPMYTHEPAVTSTKGVHGWDSFKWCLSVASILERKAAFL